MKSKTYNGEVRSSEKDFETLQLGAFATPGLLLAQGPVGLTAESGFSGEACRGCLSRSGSSKSIHNCIITQAPVARGAIGSVCAVIHGN
jgi:hypothetical protein